MRINAVAFAVLLGAAAHFGFAQSAATVDGDRIEGIVVDRGGELVAGATITFFTHQAVRYQATSDSSGVFRVPKMEPGAYEAMIEKTGFVVFPKVQWRLVPANPFGCAMRCSLVRHGTPGLQGACSTVKISLPRMRKSTSSLVRSSGAGPSRMRTDDLHSTM